MFELIPESQAGWPSLEASKTRFEEARYSRTSAQLRPGTLQMFICVSCWISNFLLPVGGIWETD